MSRYWRSRARVMTGAALTLGVIPVFGVLSASAAEIRPMHAAPPLRHSARTAPNEAVLYSFGGGFDGAYPYARLMRDPQGNLYGTTQQGGINCNCGTVYKLTPHGPGFTESIVYAFGGPGDGAYPMARLFLDKAGNFYGTTSAGGDWNAGVMFQVVPQTSGGYLTTRLHDFTKIDGAYPEAPVIGDASGNVFGTASAGGFEACSCGAVYRLGSDQGYTVVYSFRGGSDGATPVGPLVADKYGAFYGTTEIGGTQNGYCNSGCGTVYKLAPWKGGYRKTTLYRFGGFADGAFPTDGLLIDDNGALYGTTTSGGNTCAGGGCGTVFKLTPSGSTYRESILYAFANSGDGEDPTANLVQGKHGVLFGTTTLSTGLNTCNCGSVFELTPSGSAYRETILHVFAGAPTDGATPYAGLVYQQPAHMLYGTSVYGGQSNAGTVYRLSL